MDIIRLKEPQLCSLCLEAIEEGTECIRYFNRIKKLPESIKPGYIIGRGFMLHFVHFNCQYKKNKGACGLEAYMELLKAEQEQHKKKPKPTWIKFKTPYKGYKHIKTEK